MIERCLWSETIPLPSRRPAGQGAPAPLPSSTDVAIVGGGYTGLSAARTLARRGVDATVLERHTIGWGASGRNGGQVLPGYKPEMEELTQRLGSERASRMFQLSLEAIRHVASLIDEEAIACDFVRCGSITLAVKPSHMHGLKQGAQFMREHMGYHTEILSKEDLAREIGSTLYHGGQLDPSGCSLQPAKYVQGLARAAERAGARLVEAAEVTTIRRTRSGFEVTTPRGTLQARAVLAATNGYTPPALAKLRRRVIPIGSNQIATAPLPAEQARRLVPNGRVFSDTKNLLYYFRLSPDRRMVFGGRASFTPVGTKRIAGILAAGMKEVFPELAGVPIEYAWSGKVAYPIDHLPHAGQLDGVHYAMGYCGHGVALATYLGSRMGEVLAGSGEIPDLGTERFRPIPFFTGVPWFLPLAGGYYRARDWIS
jgi:glycine/D-amino acid oxidase-like deaminating enzyme